MPCSEHENDKRGQERNVHSSKRRGHDVAHPRFLSMIKETPRSAHEHRNVQGEQHALGAQPPRTRHHADRADIQRCDSQRNAHARKRAGKLPNTDKTHEGDNTNECGKRGEERDCDSGNQHDRSRDCLWKVAPGLPRLPTRGMVLTSRPRGKDAGEERTIS